MKKTHKAAICALAACVAAVGAVVYFEVDPTSSRLFPKCPFYVLTGLKCPGCGSQRALHCLLHMDVIGAMRHNFMLVASLPLLALLAIGELMRKRRPAFYAALNNARLALTAFVVVALWWIGRNVMDW